MSAKAKSKLTPEQQKATMTRVLQKIKPYGFFVVCSLIVAAVSVAAQLYIPILCGSAIDMMLGKGAVDFAGVLRIIYEIIVVAVVAAFAQWLLSVCNNRITFAVSRDLRNAAMRKIQTLPLSYLDSHPSGDIVSRMVADVDTFADGLLMGFTQLFSGVLTILGTLLFMLRQNVPITLVVVCITPLSLVVASFLAKRSYKYFQGQSTVRGEQTALVNEMIEGQKVIKVFNHESKAIAQFSGLNDSYRDAATAAQTYSGALMPAMANLSRIDYAVTCCVGGLLAIGGMFDVGSLGAYLLYVKQVSQPVGQISQQVNVLLAAVAGAERIFAVMEAELGFTLFNRGKNGVTMTSYGASLYPSIRAVLNSDEALQQSIARLNGLEKGKVKLGAFNSVCAGLLPQILKSFMASYPQIEVEVYQGTYDVVKEWLRTGQVDIAFLSNNCREEFVLTELFHEPLLCITPMDWPEPPNGVMTPALMNGQNFVVQWDATDAEMRQFLKKYSLSTERRCHVIDDQSNIAMVEAGLGISIMPRMLLRSCTAAVKI